MHACVAGSHNTGQHVAAYARQWSRSDNAVYRCTTGKFRPTDLDGTECNDAKYHHTRQPGDTDRRSLAWGFVLPDTLVCIRHSPAARFSQRLEHALYLDTTYTPGTFCLGRALLHLPAHYWCHPFP